MRALALALLLALPTGARALVQDGDTTICFTPGDACDQLVAAEIAKAAKTVHVQVYNFTSPLIIGALLDAHRRGVEVIVIIDKITASQRGEGADPLRRAGVPVFVDRKPKIAHNKVGVIDGATVITGSFNWSTNAQCCNAENLIVIRRSSLATAYQENFQKRLAASVVFVPVSRRLNPSSPR